MVLMWRCRMRRGDKQGRIVLRRSKPKRGAQALHGMIIDCHQGPKRRDAQTLRLFNACMNKFSSNPSAPRFGMHRQQIKLQTNVIILRHGQKTVSKADDAVRRNGDKATVHKQQMPQARFIHFGVKACARNRRNGRRVIGDRPADLNGH